MTVLQKSAQKTADTTVQPAPASQPTQQTDDTTTEKSNQEKLDELFAQSKPSWTEISAIITSDESVRSYVVGKSNYMDAIFGACSKNGNSAAINQILDDLYESTSDQDLLYKFVGNRFGFYVGTGDAGLINKIIAKFLCDDDEKKWGPNGLKEVYKVMMALPEDHVKRLIYLSTDSLSNNCPSGVTLNSKRINIAYNENNIGRTESGDYADRGDTMYGMTIFDTTLAHEMGHVADKGYKYSRSADFLKIAGWEEHKRSKDIVQTVVNNLKDPLPTGLNSDDKEIATDVAQKIVSREVTDTNKYQKMLEDEYKDGIFTTVGKFFVNLFRDDDTVAQEKADQKAANDAKVALIKSSNLFKHLGRGFANKDPWMYECFPELETNQIHQGYGNDSWWLYKNTARTDVKKNSRYQFRDPGEDFAELYATYYMSDETGRNQIESQRKSWFENTVVKDAK